MSLNLFMINQVYLNLVNEIMAADGEVSDELYAEFLKIEDDRDTKLENICKIISESKANIKIIEDEIERLSLVKARSNNLIDRLKRIILDTLKLHNLTGKSGNYAHKVGTYNMWTVSRKSVELDDIKLLEYNPISGSKTNNLIKFNINTELSSEYVKTINKLLEVKPTEVIIKVDKKDLLSFMESTGQTGYEEEPEEGSIEELLLSEGNLPSAISKEDKIDFAKIKVNTSLTIR